MGSPSGVSGRASGRFPRPSSGVSQNYWVLRGRNTMMERRGRATVQLAMIVAATYLLASSVAAWNLAEMAAPSRPPNSAACRTHLAAHAS